MCCRWGLCGNAGGACRHARSVWQVRVHRRSPADGRISRAKAVDAFRRLRGLGRLTNRIWIVCLGYRRFVYERRHVLEPAGAMPLDKALDIADDCLNPLSFGEDD